MTCCAPGTEGALDLARTAPPPTQELWLASRELGEGQRQSDLSVPAVHCGDCITTIERALKAHPAIVSARVNLSARRVSFVWKETVNGETTDPSELVGLVRAVGYDAHLFTSAEQAGDDLLRQLIRAVAVSGFAAVNIMLLSVSVWSGADTATRDLFHWISALIAAPALLYAGRFFFRSAFAALKNRRTNMDVPIALAVTLSYAMSLYETIHHGEHAWFDASVTLLFFLLIGRTLDHMMRDRARSAITSLARLSPRGAMVLTENGQREYLAVEDIQPGQKLEIAAGDRIPVDGRVLDGVSDIDRSIVNGESAPASIGVGDVLQAGVMNLTGPLVIEATATARDSFLSEIIRLMDAAEGGRARYRRIADRAAQVYSPAVHLLALLSFFGWLLINGDVQHAMLIAVAVLIITCPCALGLAVPVVQVVAAGRLFKSGVMVKDGSAMERLAETDAVAFDKTGTLTLGQPRLVNGADVSAELMAIAGALASKSRHPLSRALAEAAPSFSTGFEDIEERPGAGLKAALGGHIYRLGSFVFACGKPAPEPTLDGRSEVVLSRDFAPLAIFRFEDSLRPYARASIMALEDRGLSVSILSGDRVSVADALARRLGVNDVAAELSPQDKAEALRSQAEAGHKVLMVGDGINDAPALASAHVSMAPATAADVGRQAADFVFMHDGLNAVPFAIETSRQAGRLIRQNFALAIGYNVIAVPIAILGYATPLVAAIAMSTSSIIVVVNALRLSRPVKSESGNVGTAITARQTMQLAS